MIAGAFQANLDEMEFVPMSPQELAVEVLEGNPDFRLHVLRETADETGKVWAGIGKVAPSSLRYKFEANETIYVVDGEATVLDETAGATIELRPGGMVSFPKGLTTTWTFKSPFTEVFVETGV